MIPDEKQPAVARALQAAFGVTQFEDSRLLTGGLSSAFALKIIVNKNPYLLKILRKEIISDPANEFACMQAGAKAGIAPRIWYANVEDRVLITDYVEARPLPAEMLPLIVPTLRTLHALPPFPMPRMGSYIDAASGFVRRFKAARLLPDSATEEVFRRFAEVEKVYPRDGSEFVSCHNDLKPQNMRFDGDRLWLVDWESAFRNDRYVDLAIVANFFVENDAQEEDYLGAYFGEPAGDYRRARFFLMRQIAGMFYATLLLMEVARAGLPIDADLSTPGFRDYHRDLIADRIDMLTPEAKLQYGLLHLREALRNLRTPRCAEAIARVGAAHASE
jgi:hypothetical protein